MKSACIGFIGICVTLGLTLGATAQAPSPWDRESGGVFGRVFFDHDGTGGWSKGDEGVAGAWLVTDTGEVIITDEDGRYHVFLVSAGYEVLGSHAIRLDGSSLPVGTTCLSSMQKLFHLAPLEFVRVDFPLNSPISRVSDAKGLKQAKEHALAVIRPDPDSGSILAAVGGIAEDQCQIWINGSRVALDSEGAFVNRVNIRPGVNPHFVTVHCQDGRLEFIAMETHWVKRDRGGDLIVPARPRTLATCKAPAPGRVSFAPYMDISCRLESGVQMEVDTSEIVSINEPAKNVRYRVRLHSGANRVLFRIFSKKTGQLEESIQWMMSPIRWTGVFLGSSAWSYSESSSVLAGKLRGFFQLDLPFDLDLMVGIGLDSKEQYKGDESDGSGSESASDLIWDALAPGWNPWKHEREPDPELGIPVSGDQAVVYDHNPSDSRYLLRLRRKSSHLGWGGFTTGQGASSEIGTYRRALFGAHGSIRPLEDLSEGSRRKVDLWLGGFYAPKQPEQNTMVSVQMPHTGPTSRKPSHEEFLATGGSLYFLGHKRVVEGSEQIQVHRRDERTGLTLERRVLRRNLDYQVDWLTGRILLTRPLDTGLMGGGVVRMSPASGAAPTVLVVDYEYLDLDDVGSSHEVAGGRAGLVVRLTENVKAEAAVNAAYEFGDVEYRLYKTEARISVSQHAAFWLAFSSNRGRALQPAYSVDGGLSFEPAPVPQSDTGEAYEAGVSLDYASFRSRLMFRRWLDGFSDTSLLADGDMTQLFGVVETSPFSFLDIVGRCSGTEWGPDGRQDAGKLLEGYLRLGFKLSESISISGQGAMDQGSGEQLLDGQRLVSGLRLKYQATPQIAFSAGHQQTLWAKGEGWASTDVSMSSVGARVTFLESYNIGLEGGWGPSLGNMVNMSFSEKQADGRLVFANTTFSLDRPSVGKGTTITTGQTAPTENGWLLTTAQSLDTDGIRSMSGQQMSLDVPLSDPWRIRFHYTRSELHDAGNEDRRKELYLGPFFDRRMWGLNHPGRRNTIHTRLAYLTKTFALSTSGEFRVDEHLPLGQTASQDMNALTTHRQTVFTIAANWKILEDLTLGGRMAWAETFGKAHGSQGPGIGEGRFLETSLGLVYRPTDLDWLRLWFRVMVGEGERPVTFTNDSTGWRVRRWWLGSLGFLAQPSRYFQPTLVLAPCIYEFGYAGANQDIRTIPVSTTLVGMLRIGSQIFYGLGISAELRMLGGSWELDTIPDMGAVGLRTGAALELFYMLEGKTNGGVRLGIGYSFSDLPDPMYMSDLRAGNKGLFIRLEGML